MDGDQIWNLLESYGWKRKEENEIMYFKPAQSYLTELTEGFHLFHTGKQLLEYLHRYIILCSSSSSSSLFYFIQNLLIPIDFLILCNLIKSCYIH